MIRSYKCTQAIKDKHYNHFGLICTNRIDACIGVFSLIANKIINPDVIRKRLASYNKNYLRSTGSTILSNYNYKNLGFDELVSELSTSVNIAQNYKNHAKSIQKLLEFVKSPKVLKSILVGKPKDLELLYDKTITSFPTLVQLNKQYLNEVKSIFSKIFNYESFKNDESWNTHQLQLELGNKYCLYCNLVSLPEKGYSFDHCIPQTEYPIFAISLFNLIPSCTTCNTNNKRTTPFFTDTHIHPYFKDYLESYSFEIDYLNNLLNIRGKYKTYSINYKCSDPDVSKIIKNSFDDLKLLSEYKFHKNEIDNCLDTIYFYDSTYIQSVIDFINGRGEPITLETLYHSLFNRELDSKKFCCNSYSRLIYDICNNNGIMENLKMELGI